MPLFFIGEGSGSSTPLYHEVLSLHLYAVIVLYLAFILRSPHGVRLLPIFRDKFFGVSLISARVFGDGSLFF